MNFRPKIGKVIASIIVPILIGAFSYIINTGLLNINLPSIINTFLSMHNIKNISGPMDIAPFIVDLIVVYLIISIFQRGKKKEAAAPSQPVQQQPAQMPPYQPTVPYRPVVNPQARIPPQ